MTPTFERGKMVWNAETQAHVINLIRKGFTAQAIADKLGTTRNAILGGTNRHKLGSISRAGVIPDDFAKLWPTMSIRELARHYDVGRSTPPRWAGKLGLGQKDRGSPTSTAKRAKLKSPRKGRDAYNTRAPFDTEIYREDSEAGRAAQFLQRFGFVYRCSETGAPNPRGKFWNRGGRVLSDDDVISRAQYLLRRAA